MNLLKIKEHDDILDVGCGVGNLTKKIREISKGKVVGIDPSEKMISEARSRQLDITFEQKSAETMDFRNCFEVIFCNSAFQWFRNPKKALENCYTALRTNGRMGIQAPAKKLYCPNFIDAIEEVKKNQKTKDTFAHFRSPWTFFETADEYSNLFESAGFKVDFSRIETIKTNYSPEEVFAAFSSGAIAGYLNQDFYDRELPEDYEQNFKAIVRDAFGKQADAANTDAANTDTANTNRANAANANVNRANTDISNIANADTAKRAGVDLIFNRIYLLAVKNNRR